MKLKNLSIAGLRRGANNHRCISRKLGSYPYVALVMCLLMTTVFVQAEQDRDYMAVVNRPNLFHLLDLEDRRIVRTCELPASVAPGTVVMSPDKSVAYILGGRFDRLYGIAINGCELVFDAQFSQGNVRNKSIASLAVSRDGSELYSIHNPVTIMNDHYQVSSPKFVVYSATDGIDAKPVRSYPAPRQVNILATGHDGQVYLSGPDVYAFDPKTGETSVAIASRNAQREGYGQPDILTVWPLGSVNEEFLRMYSVPKFSQPGAEPELLWGYERVDLVTGETSVKDFGPLEEVLFTGMLRPHHPDEFYGVLTQLKRHRVSTQSVIQGVDLERTYYCINFSTDGSTIYLGGTYNDIAIYDADTLESQGKIVLPGGDMSMSTPQVFSALPTLVGDTEG